MTETTKTRTAEDAIAAYIEKRTAQGYTADRETDGSYIIWTGTKNDEHARPVQVVAIEGGRAYAYTLPVDIDPTLPAHLMVEQATEGVYLH